MPVMSADWAAAAMAEEVSPPKLKDGQQRAEEQRAPAEAKAEAEAEHQVWASCDLRTSRLPQQHP